MCENREKEIDETELAKARDTISHWIERDMAEGDNAAQTAWSKWMRNVIGRIMRRHGMPYTLRAPKALVHHCGLASGKITLTPDNRIFHGDRLLYPLSPRQ